jgi:hypothetical protein
MNTMGEKSRCENPRKSRLAIVSLISGLLSVLLLLPVARILDSLVLVELFALSLMWLLPFTTLLLGILAMYQINKAKGLLKGRVFAGIGVFFSVLALPLSSLFIMPDIGVYTKSEVVKIDNVTNEMTVLLSNKDRQKSVMSIRVSISGYLNGSATIFIGECEYKVPSGKVHLKFGGDWYSDECLIKYKPLDVHSGYLAIRYYFEGFDSQ